MFALKVPSESEWTHFNVVMGAHEHTTPINPEVVQFIVDKIKATEKKP